MEDNKQQSTNLPKQSTALRLESTVVRVQGANPQVVRKRALKRLNINRRNQRIIDSQAATEAGTRLGEPTV